jgi:hypothetical protein
MTIEIIRHIVGYLCLWSVVGYFLSALDKTELKSRKQSLYHAILYGPLCWGIILIMGLGIKLKKSQKHISKVQP